MSKPNPRTTGHLLVRITTTFCCFIVALMVLWYWGMGGDFATMQKFFLSKSLSSLSDEPPALFYQAIGIGAGNSNAEPAKTVKNMFTLELQVVATRSQADRIISDLMKRGIRAFYIEYPQRKDSSKKTFSIRRGLYPTLEEAQSASRILLAQSSIRNRVVELSH